MNIANPCKVLVLVGAVAFGGFALRADGTLPIPHSDTDVQFPLLMGGAATQTVDAASTDLDISMTLDLPDTTIAPADLIKACGRSTFAPVAYPASGTVQVGIDLFNIRGLCAPSTGSSTKRTVVASTSGRLLQLDGDFKVSPSTRKLNFAGSALTFDSVTTSPESGGQTTKVITFKMDQLP
ncbi:MAG: hypothetical protein EOP10_17750 [Proteobacteria bacterium]|nr:MAG: hypothetical protein EOP10_17750 [Pseudomonadota bacterium]